MIVHGPDLGFVKAVHIFGDFFFVGFEKLLLNSEGAAEIFTTVLTTSGIPPIVT